MDDRRTITAALTQGARRWLASQGYAAIAEFTPTRGLRCDLFALGAKGDLWAVEVKSGAADYVADHKWRKYLDYCDRFSFCVSADFDRSMVPEEVGVMVADAYDAHVVRPAPEMRLAPARRKALTVRLARAAADRLMRLEDPGAAALDDLA